MLMQKGYGKGDGIGKRSGERWKEMKAWRKSIIFVEMFRISFDVSFRGYFHRLHSYDNFDQNN